MKNRILLILLITVSLFSGCTKYEDGPLLSLYSKGMRVNGTWYFDQVRYDGADSTIHYPYNQFNFFFVKETDGGGFTWNRNIWAQEMSEDLYLTGTWKFLADRDSFRMVIYKNDLRDSTITKWKINRLAYTEFWIERTIRDSILLEWHLIKYIY